MTEEFDQDVQLEEQPVAPAEPEAPEIEVVDDRPEQDRRPPRVGEPKVEDPNDANLPKHFQRRIATVTYNFHEEQRQRLEAERQRDEAIAWAKKVAQQNQDAEGRAAFGTKIAIESTNARFAAEHDKAVDDLKQAFDAGDATKIAEATSRLARVSTQRTMVPQVPAAPPVQAPAPPPVPQAPPQRQPTALEAKWAQDNAGWFGKDEVMTNSAREIHTALVENGVLPGSPAYFNIIDARLREVFPDKFEDSTQHVEPQKSAQRKLSVVAPSTRVSPTGVRKVTVTRTQVELAKRLGVPIEEYIKYVDPQ